MAIYNNTRIVLRHFVARICNDLLLGTVTSPASGTFVCEEAAWEKPDDYFNHWIEVFCYAGTGIGTKGNPTDWDNSTHTLTFLPAATLTANDSVEMHERFRVDEYNDFINLAIEMVAREALVYEVDETVELATDTYQYDLPTEFLYISGVFMESGTSGLYDMKDPINTRYWRIVHKATTVIEFVKNLWSPTDGRKIRITGFASPAKLSTDSSEYPINPTYIMYQAAAFLHQSRIRGQGSDSEWHSGQLKFCQALANEARRTTRVFLGGVRPVVEA